MFEKHGSRIRLKLNFMDVTIIHKVEFKDDVTAVILRGSPFYGTVPPTKIFKKHCKIAVFLYCASVVLTEMIQKQNRIPAYFWYCASDFPTKHI